MSRDKAEELGLRPETKTSITVGHLGGSTTSSGRVRIDLTIGRQTKPIFIHIFDNFRLKFLIGLNDIALFDVQPDVKTRKMNFVTAINGDTTQGHEKFTGNPLTSVEGLIDERIFASSKNDVGRIAVAKHHIRVRGSVAPISRRPYRQSAAMNEVTRKLVDEMLDAGVIRPSTSPWSFPVTLVRKKTRRGGSLLTTDHSMPLQWLNIRLCHI